MPLIVISGYPCCGKTTFAKLLAQSIKEKLPEKEVFIINEEFENITKLNGYSSSTNEKNTRGVLKSAINHKLSADTYVIADSLNYIKGYRYELFCIAKAFRTPHCVVWVEADETLSLQWNEAREDKYDEKILLDLRKRYEIPCDKNRWDNPLFRINVSPKEFLDSKKTADETAKQFKKLELNADSSTSVSVAPKAAAKSSWKPKSKKSSSTTEEMSTKLDAAALQSAEESSTQLPTTALSFSGSFVPITSVDGGQESIDITVTNILNYLTTAVAPVPNVSTLPIFHGNPDQLYELDQTSKTITEMIISHQSMNSEGTPIIFKNYNRSLTLHRQVSMAELQRHRRQFTSLNSKHPPANSQLIGEAFVDFLSIQI